MAGVGGKRMETVTSCHPPPGAATCHPNFATATRAARGAAPTSIHGRVGDASLPCSAEDEGEEGEGQDDDDHKAAAVWAAAVDAALPFVPEGGFFVHVMRCGLI